jgi:hypothetical protein
MRVAQHRYRSGLWTDVGPPLEAQAHLVLAFGGTEVVSDAAPWEALRQLYPGVPVVGCSTAGEILGTTVDDHSLVVTAIHFEHTHIAIVRERIEGSDSKHAGQTLAARLSAAGLVHVLVLSDGIGVNGTALVQGLLERLPPGVAVTGGLAGDGERMQTTYVHAEGTSASQVVAAVGFYGSRLRVGYGSMGGWDSFGPERLITSASGNVLHELDGLSALSLYKRYLGDHAAGLPATALLFPLSVRPPDGNTSVVRTILGVDEESQTMTFAGDMPSGHYARLMKANFDRLVDGAFGAGRISLERGGHKSELALLISCVGRRLILKDRVEEELESVAEALGSTPMTGFYSNGELCPSGQIGCELHNQTMTVTTFTEV